MHIFCQWDEISAFFAAVFPSNCAIFDTQSSKMKGLRAKMRQGNDLCHSLDYKRSCSMPDHRYNILQKALFVDIKVLIAMVDSDLFQSNEEIKAFSRLVKIRSWTNSGGRIGSCPETIAKLYQLEYETAMESEEVDTIVGKGNPESIDYTQSYSLESHFRVNPKFF